MKTALDSSVILDVITDDPTWAEPSVDTLIIAGREGSLIIGECVLAEITPAIGSHQIAVFLNAWNIKYHPSSQESATLAGEMYERYLERGGAAKRVLPDFLIGAHAMNQASRLLARDRGYYRDYFKGLNLLEPVR